MYAIIVLLKIEKLSQISLIMQEKIPRYNFSGGDKAYAVVNTFKINCTVYILTCLSVFLHIGHLYICGLSEYSIYLLD